MVSDAEIVRRLAIVLRKADLSTTTTGAVRKQLEEDLGVDLSDRKAFIREQVDIILAERQEEEEEEEEQEEGEEEANGEPEEENQDEGEEEEREEQVEVKEEKPRRRTRQSLAEPDDKRFKAKIDRACKASLPKEKKKRTGGGGGGLMKACSLSPELQAIIGETQLPRTQVVKQLWVYIRENELQDPDNKRRILCNDELRRLFGVEYTDIFKMNKLLSKHIWPLDRPAEGEADRKFKKQKTEKTSPLSEELIQFLGTEETEMPQPDVMKHIWDYIGAHKLQDPKDRKTIICDEKLQDLFSCETFVGFDLSKLLAPHLQG